ITILVSTPYMDEAVLCDRIALIQSGKILSVDTPANTVKKYPTKLYAAKASDMHQLLKDIRSYTGVASCFTFGESLHFTFRQDDAQTIAGLKATLDSGNYADLVVNEIQPNIEDYFIQISEPVHA
ncbi:MAG: ABC transporter ATP-binding protein, partial [Bacteroidetes bacterium]|nr:ABC transporter ATP-binding protein [Bacteroidota bacterium]